MLCSFPSEIFEVVAAKFVIRALVCRWRWLKKRRYPFGQETRFTRCASENFCRSCCLTSTSTAPLWLLLHRPIMEGPTLDDTALDGEQAFGMPLEFQKLSTLLEDCPETLASGNLDIQTVALNAAKHIFDLCMDL